MEQLEEHIDLVFINGNPLLDFIRPLTPNTIQLGFMHLTPPKEILDFDLEDILDRSTQGVIYMSFGSNVKSKDLSTKTIKIFLNVFQKLPFQVLLKFEEELPTNCSQNVRISKWFPQSDLLAHQNVKLFITQGGLNSIEEAIDREIPIITIPFMFDQFKNALKAQEEGFGLRLDVDDLTEEKLNQAIAEIMHPKYRENIVKFKKLVYDQPMTSPEKAVWWTEYVIRHGGVKHLKFPGRKVPFYQRCCIDVVFILSLLAYLIAKMFVLFRHIRRITKTKTE